MSILPPRFQNGSLGGARPGAGRRKEIARRLTAETANKLAEAGDAPLDKMVDNYRHFSTRAASYETLIGEILAAYGLETAPELFALSIEALPNDRKRGKESPRKMAERLVATARSYRVAAQWCARDAAPYCHAKLYAQKVQAELQGKQAVAIYFHDPRDELV